MDIKKIHKGLIDKEGRRKYFKELNPVLLKDPFNLDKSKITKKPRILFIMPNFHWIDEDVNALWDLLPWNLCQIAAMIEDVCEEVKIVDAYKYNLSKKDLQKNKISFRKGIYTWTIGPSYETVAEINDIICIGGDAVGMSTVPEIIESIRLEMNVLGVTCLTNYGAGLTKTKPSHKEVLLQSKKSIKNFTKLLLTIIENYEK